MSRRRRASSRTIPDPLAIALTQALIGWLEGASLGSSFEEFQFVPDHDRGDPSDPFLAVYTKTAPASGDSQSPRRVEIVIALEASNPRSLPDNADELLRDLHDRIAMPLDPATDPEDAVSDTAAPFSDLLEWLLSAPTFRLLSLQDVRHPTLFHPAKGFDQLVYVGIIQPRRQRVDFACCE